MEKLGIQDAFEAGKGVATFAGEVALNGLKFVAYQLRGGAWGNELQEATKPASITFPGEALEGEKDVA